MLARRKTIEERKEYLELQEKEKVRVGQCCCVWSVLINLLH